VYDLIYSYFNYLIPINGYQMRIMTILFLLLITQSCNKIRETTSNLIDKPQPVLIDIQPFEGITAENITFVYKELHKIFPNVKINKSVPLPIASYYKQRKRFRADSLIRYLDSITPMGHITIGLTDKDISHSKGKIKDYGIMGLGYRPGKACVVSTFRLSKKNRLEQLFKFSIHELGHTQGLTQNSTQHCPVKTCFMRDAEGENHADEMKSFCISCKEYLVSKGWRIKG
jgi:archaemetzincin